MSTQPPPLPAWVASQKQSSFARQAANACAAAPLILVGLSFCWSTLVQNHRDASGRPLALIIGALGCFIVLVGAVLGLLAIIFARRGERGWVIGRASIGFGITALLLVIAIPNFVRARRNAIANREAFQSVTATANDLRRQTTVSLKKHDLQSVDLSKFEQSLDRAAETTSGDTSAMIKATRAYFQRVQALQLAYEKASAELRSARILVVSNLVERGEIRPREAVVQKFLASNNDLKAFVG